MRNYYDENDEPIKEVGRKSIFGRIKSFEESDEYNFEKEMKEYEKAVSEKLRKTVSSSNNTYEYSNQSNYSTTSSTNLTITMVVFIFFIIFISIFASMAEMMNYTSLPKHLSIETSLGSENPYLNDEYDKQIYYKLSSISFDGAGKIVTLYEYDKQTKGIWCNFTEKDERFNELVNTFQIHYNYIPVNSSNKLRNGLIERNFKHIVDYPTGSVYAMNRNNGYCLFVLISEKDIIYGAFYGEYQDLFGE